jgi:hypothetical protein
MKTPREILFQRHEAAGPKLDVIRREVVARHCKSTGSHSDGASAGILVRFWQELFLPCRHVWTGLGAIWAVLLIINLAQRESTPRNLAKSLPPAEPMMTLYNQEKILNEMLADRTQPLEATRPPKFEPKPRSEATEMTTI